jgi:hypothetical protein
MHGCHFGQQNSISESVVNGTAGASPANDFWPTDFFRGDAVRRGFSFGI